MRRLGVLHAGQQAMPAALGQTDRSKDTQASALAGAPRGRLSRIQRGDHHRRAKRRHRGRSKAAKPAAPVPVRLPHRATAVGGGSLRRQNGNARPAGQNSESLKVCRPGQFAELPLPLPIHASPARSPSLASKVLVGRSNTTHGSRVSAQSNLLRCCREKRRTRNPNRRVRPCILLAHRPRHRRCFRCTRHAPAHRASTVARHQR